MSERREFVALAASGSVPFAELCRRFGVSRKTGYEWQRRWEVEGDAGLVDRSRRPHTSPTRTPAEIEDLVVEVRNEHQAWGGRKINQVLRRLGHTEVPAASTITDILRRRGLLAPTVTPRAYVRFERGAPNELWQMDFKGWFTLANGDRCHTFGMLDDHSRFNLTLAACADQRTATVKTLITAAFQRCGLPGAILCDNGSPWGNDRRYRWTPLGVWLLDLGVSVIHSRPFHPQTAGKQERFHHTLDLEVLATRPVWDNLATVQGAYDPWREIYNHQRPHDALGDMVVPADRYQPSLRTMPETIPDIEYPDGYTIRQVSGTTISYHGNRYRVGRPFEGKPVGIVPTTNDGIYLVYYRHQHIRTIDTTTP